MTGASIETTLELWASSPAFVTFGLDAKAKVERVMMKSMSPTPDLSYDHQDLMLTPVKEQ